MIAAVLSVTVPVLASGVLFTAFGNRTASPSEARRRWIKYAVYVIVVHVVVFSFVAGHAFAAALFVVVAALSGIELKHALRTATVLSQITRIGVFAAYIGFSLAALHAVLRLPSGTLVFLYLVVAAFDGGSEAVGHIAGKHRLAPTISPGKTIEGAVGGVVVAAIVGVLLANLLGRQLSSAVTALPLILCCALLGDLAAALIKRRAGIKDYGTLIPGHGGILDRFNSFIAASAVAGNLLHISN
jgi:phosphatidate cytidylyltransferase